MKICEKFLNLKTPRDVADLLDVRYNWLIYLLYKNDLKKQYKSFHLTKKSGGLRKINAPVGRIKTLQRRLNDTLQDVYKPKHSVHSFCRNKSIRTNAQYHIRKRYVFNIDLKNFFPSINF